MDDPVPSIDFSPSGNLDASYSLEREDVDGNYSPHLIVYNITKFFFRSSSRIG